MKKFFEKIKNWLKTEKVVKRSTLILLCLAVFACGILYTFIISCNSCTEDNNSSNVDNVKLVSNTVVAEDDISLPTSVEEYSLIDKDFNYKNVSSYATLSLPKVSRPDITGNEVDEIYDYIYKYANEGFIEPIVDANHFVDYFTRQTPYLTYGQYENMLYLPESTYSMKMFDMMASSTPSGLTLRIDSNGIIHINGTATCSSILRIDISELLKYSFLDVDNNYILYTCLVSSHYSLDDDLFVTTYYNDTKNYIHSSTVWASNGREIFSDCYKFNSFDIDLQFLIGAGTYNDLQFRVGLVKNSTYVNDWQDVTPTMHNLLGFATKTQVVYDMYRTAIYGFNMAYDNFDNYADLIENEIYNSRVTLIDMLSSVVSAPINFMKDTLNFSLFGFNLFNILASILTLILTAFVIKKLL